MRMVRILCYICGTGPGLHLSLVGLEGLQCLGVLGALLLDVFLQDHILHLYGVSGLANPN